SVTAIAMAADQRRSLQAVDIRHVDIQKDDGERAFQHAFERLCPGARLDDLCIEILQQAAVNQQLLGKVIDYQDSRPIHLADDSQWARVAADSQCAASYNFQQLCLLSEILHKRIDLHLTGSQLNDEAVCRRVQDASTRTYHIAAHGVRPFGTD